MHSFRRILRTALLFFLIVAVVSFGLMELYFRTESDYFQDGSERTALAGSLDCLILGASHAYRAFDPTVIDPILGTGSYNLSGSLMSMRGRWELLQKEAARNPVKTVVFDVSYNTMTRSLRDDGVEGELYMMARLDRLGDRIGYLSAFYPEELPEVYYKFFSEGVDVAVALLRGRFEQEGQQRRRGFMPTGESDYVFPSDYQSVYRTRWRWLLEDVDADNLRYLDRITAFCQENGIELILVTTPLSKEFLCTYGDFDVFYNWYCDYAAAHGLRYYDFNLYREKETLFPDRETFYDPLHLNPDGAERFSRLFAELELRAEAGEDLSDLFYDSYAALDRTWGLHW